MKAPNSVIYGRVENVKAFPSTGLTRIEITVPVEAYPAVVAELFGKDVLVSIPSSDLRSALGRYGVHVAGGIGHDEITQPANPGKAVAASECGPLCKWAGMVCKEPEFWEYMGTDSEEAAAAMFRVRCGVDSRREIDSNPEASGMAHKLRHEFMAWKSGKR